MKKLAAAALVALLSTSAEAAIVISFTGTTTTSSVNGVEDSGPQSVSGTLTIDTAKLPANTGTPSDVSYYGDNFTAGDALFMTLSFTSTGATPLTGGPDLDNLIANDSRPAPFNDPALFAINGAGALLSFFQLYSENQTFAADFGGYILPDFTGLNGVRFAFTSYGADTIDSQGTIDSISYAVTADVPEPATWAMMAGGFGVIGFALRRRKTSVTFA